MGCLVDFRWSIQGYSSLATDQKRNEKLVATVQAGGLYWPIGRWGLVDKEATPHQSPALGLYKGAHHILATIK